MTIINKIEKIEFIIDHIDPLGQGVYKQEENIFFIPKTLPGESGIAKILKRKKGVYFCKVIELYTKSTQRVESTCPHYNVCNGCHFLHTSYEDELEYKKVSFSRMLKFLNYSGNIEVLAAPQRLQYRNRIQLHYNQDAQILGFKDGKSNRIIEVPHCKISKSSISKKLTNLYIDQNWLIQSFNHSPKGHIEIYDSPEGLKTTWNQQYSSGGFTQVNQDMNKKMQDYLHSYLESIERGRVLDLFGGRGNLSNSYSKNRLVVDIYDNKDELGEEFFSLNLHKENALDKFNKEYPGEDFQTLIIDPPRAGFPLIKQWVEEKSPQNICYISCHPQTMIRDLKKIQELDNYSIKNVVLLDLFPSTFHFEALVTLERVSPT